MNYAISMAYTQPLSMPMVSERHATVVRINITDKNSQATSVRGMYSAPKKWVLGGSCRGTHYECIHIYKTNVQEM